MRDFRQHLQAELARRCARNSRYSLRAFALSLRVNHSTLSQILRGKRAITSQTIRRLGARLKLDRYAIEQFVAELNRQSAGADGPIRDADELARDMSAAVAEWQHHAILELVELPEFRADSRWLARVLDLSTDEVNIALQRLLRLGMLEMSSCDKWLARGRGASNDSRTFALAALRQIVARAQRLIQIIDAKEKSNGQPRHAVADSRQRSGADRAVLREDV
ncbi:MAG: DUF4423 domain-containing protein [Tepidisphaeraceae bacterium]